jgi:SAM-dependent methyltransferase
MSTAYSSSYYAIIEKIENSHFWFQARKLLIKKTINKFIPNTQNMSFLEVGFGTGIMIRLLESMGFKVTGIDIKQKALEYAKIHTKAILIRKSIFSFKTNGKYDAIGAFDVLEHQQKDVEFLKAMASLLKKGGYIFINVPANMYLWSEIDVLSKHERRYSISGMAGKIEKAGLKVVFINYWQMATIPVFWLRRKMLVRKNRDIIKEYLDPPPNLINRLFYYLLITEQYFVLKFRMFTGSSLIAVAQKIQD